MCDTALTVGVEGNTIDLVLGNRPASKPMQGARAVLPDDQRGGGAPAGGLTRVALGRGVTVSDCAGALPPPVFRVESDALRFWVRLTDQHTMGDSVSRSVLHHRFR